MYGMIYSLKSFISKVSPIDLKEGYFSYATNKYLLNFYETPTKLKIVLTTDLSATGIRELIQQIFNQVYVEYVVLNPMCALDKPIESELFATKLDEVVRQSPAFAPRVP
ncbi:UNVERIFIED_CONTAM: hypothetical protein GTU68_021713 [Idotea baltica]|nr:hypothetical protein [Idotea baltica]